MAGHSKWANIKHKKASQDSKKMKIFQKISKEITIAIKEGGTDLSSNSKLRLAIEKAKANNIPNENIKKMLNKPAKNDAELNEITYEGYGNNGIAIIVEVVTDNVNRTSSYVKSAFNKHNGNLGTSGSVLYLFESKGVIVFDNKFITNEEIFEKIMEMEIEDIQEEEDVIILKTNPKNIFKISDELKTLGITEFLEVEVKKIPFVNIDASEQIIKKIISLVDYLEESDDVLKVYTNLTYHN